MPGPKGFHLGPPGGREASLYSVLAEKILSSSLEGFIDIDMEYVYTHTHLFNNSNGNYNDSNDSDNDNNIK